MDPLMSFRVDHNDGLPVWLQIRNRIAYLVTSGAYCEGDKLPTVRGLAADLDISYNTVNRAYMDLEREGYIASRRGKGTFVTGSNIVANEAEYRTIDTMADDLVHAARNFGMDDGSILALVQGKLC